MAVALLVLMALPVLSISASDAAAQEKSLKLYFVHTGEKAVITFKRNGKFDPKGLAQINQFLRDWRRNEPARMDPRLFDLVWEVYRRSGASDYIHVVSAYRSPTTNNMLRTRSRNTGVAKNSQHMLGKAMDFYIPGVKLSTLRALAMQMQVGGVGFYPTSGSPFVHLDVGGVRAWPRMTRQELVQIFPNGNTIHLPADGKPLPGYETALADYKRRVGSDSIQIASTAGGGIRGDGSERKRQPNLLAFLFGGGGADEEEDNEESAAPAVARRAAPAAKPAGDDEGEAPVAVASASPLTGQNQAQTQNQAPAQAQTIAAPVPLSRPAFRSDAGGFATALYSPARNPAQEALALQAAAPAQPGAETFADLSAYNIPVPTLLGPRGLRGDAESGVMTASVGPMPALEEIASVPLPGQRPNIAAAAPAAKAEEQQELTPALVAALAQSVEPRQEAAAPMPIAPTQPASAQPASAQPAAAQPAPAMAAAPTPAQKPVEMASASPKVIHSNRGTQFGDGFDAPRSPVTASTSALPIPAKGGRPNQNAPQSANGGTLTGDALAKWALNNNRASAAASMKAPRVVSRTLNNEYSAGYSGGGFRPVAATVAIDPNRFSGPNN
ncbi:uncharacterized protein YcbK (DUF882 family) [Neorhizobium galegae]|uniref:DUF882 domain-containing protein n=1 Tax=Neorhizobium galegae TaxID=399 RepID=UPI001AE0F793|nr:DUF882 domain-containing protein [Neorhizobium galegae]MBP2557821.1 uncharacterized protein YcbK (DUF882 family) [Neorhizobium galegae]